MRKWPTNSTNNYFRAVVVWVGIPVVLIVLILEGHERVAHAEPQDVEALRDACFARGPGECLHSA